MAKYTVTIRTLIDNDFDFRLNTYPIFDENYRNVLNEKILFHYYENEIGFETAPLFRFYLHQKLNEIMPYYNELYKAQKHLLDEQLLFNNVNLTESLSGTNTKNDTASGSDNIINNTSTSTSGSNTSNGTNTTSGTQSQTIEKDTSNDTTKSGTDNTSSSNTTTSSSNSSSNSNSKKLFQDTPQGQISSIEIDNQTWATNLTLDSSTNQTAIQDTSTSTGQVANTTSETINNDLTEATSSSTTTSETLTTSGSNTSSGSETSNFSSSQSTNNTLNSSGTNNYIKTIIGNNGAKFNIDILNDVKNNLLNIDLMIINDLQELFMQIF